MKRLIIITALTVMASAILGGCNSSKSDIYSDQQSKIRKYLESECAGDPTGLTYFTMIEGSNRLTRKQGSSVAFESGDTVDFIFTGYLFDSYKFDNSKIFTTNDVGIEWNVTDKSLVENAPFRFISGESNLFTGLNLGLEGIHDKEECEIIFPSILGTGESHIGTITANTPLAFKVRVDSVRKSSTKQKDNIE